AWWIDRFGNAQTNLSPDDLAAVGLRPGGMVTVKIGTRLLHIPWVRAYGEVGEGEALLHVDSSGMMALAVRGGEADQELGLAEGTTVSMVGAARSEADEPDDAGDGDEGE
ncbi:MAG TPA: SAM hydroxide adenosyltransferase, partial [Longimicrobiales bacterium]|nr:SAM hydroxide adenosyltransferase [Longimicrobiales bacterium]